MLGFNDREPKPRNSGLNLVIDVGLPTGLFEDYIKSFHDYIDGVKFGWGSGLITPQIDQKIEILQANDIDYWFGGTAFEIAFNSGRVDEFVKWILSKKAKRIEISDGVMEIPSIERIKMIQKLSKEMEVYSEVGRKNPARSLSPSVWIQYIKGDIEAGASKVILEGRESGRAGVFRPNREVRTGLIDDIDFSGIDHDKLIFEAPTKDQQVWFVKRFGRHCNLANIPFSSVLNVETLRSGLRGDTSGG